MSEKTPGQAAYEAWQDILIRSTPQIQAIPWDDLTDDLQAWWADEEREIGELSALIAEREPLTVRPSDDVKQPACGVTPGRAAWTAYWGDPDGDEQHAWDMCPQDARDAWEAAARAAIAAAQADDDDAWEAAKQAAAAAAAQETEAAPIEHNLALEGDWPTIVAKIERERDSLTGRVAELLGDVNRLTAERDELSAKLADAVSPAAGDYDNAAEILRLTAERDQARAAVRELLDCTGLDDDERQRYLEHAGLADDSDDDMDDEPRECQCTENQLYGTCGH